MIAFGYAVPDLGVHRRRVEPGIELAAEPGARHVPVAPVEPLARAYNLVLERAAALKDLEALVLVHPRAEITDRDLCAKVRAALSDPDVAITGCAGAANVTSLAWWEGDVSVGSVTHSFEEHGGGAVPAFEWAQPGPAPSEVDAVDGLLLVMSPWAVRELRFDEALGADGYDVDICLQARAAGKRVTTADLRVTQHRSLDLVDNADLWIQSYIRLAEKWFEGEPDEQAWRRRARRAEAEREAARISGAFTGLAADARIEELEEELAAALRSTSWRLTAPLRAVNRLLRRPV